MDTRTVGILGSGQLGRMMVESGSKLGIKMAILGPGSPNHNILTTQSNLS